MGDSKKEKKKEKDEDEDDIKEEGEKKADEITADDSAGKEGRMVYKRSARHYLRDHLEGSNGAELTCADFHQKTKILVTGFNNGAFLLLSLPDCSLVHSLAIGEEAISSARFNISGDWVALGCPGPGQLLVWEWQSETYVMKQQGHGGVKLGEATLLRRVLEGVPHSEVPLLASQVSKSRLPSLLQFVAGELESSRHIQFYLAWTRALLISHGTFLKAESKKQLPMLNHLIKSLTRKSEDLSKVCEHNKYTISYLKSLSKTKRQKALSSEEEDMEIEDEDGETIVREVSADSDDEDMTELAAKWSDGDE